MQGFFTLLSTTFLFQFYYCILVHRYTSIANLVLVHLILFKWNKSEYVFQEDSNHVSECIEVAGSFLLGND